MRRVFGLFAGALAALVLAAPALAFIPAEMDANPEVQSYTGGLFTFNKTWSVAAAGSSWSVTYGDGISSGTQPISRTSITHTFAPMGVKKDYVQSFRAVDSLGGVAIDETRVVYTR